MTYFLAFHWLVFVVRPAFVITGYFHRNFEYIGIQPTSGELCKTLIVILIGFVSLVVGFELSVRNAKAKKFQLLANARGVDSALLISALLFVPLGLYGQAVAFSGGVSAEQAGNIKVLIGGSGYLIGAPVALLTFAIVCLYRFDFKPLAWIPFAGYCLVSLIFNVSRWSVIFGVIALLILYFVRKNRIPWVRLIVIVPTVCALFLIKGRFRDVYEGVLMGDAQRGMQNLHALDLDRASLVDNQDFGNYEFLTYLVSIVPKETGTYTYFTQWLQIFTEPIPRMWWAEKPLGAPIQRFDVNDYGNFFGLTNSIIGDGWLSFGFLGVVLTCGFVGFVLGALQARFFSRPRNAIELLTYILFISLLFQLFRDGGISIFKFMLFTVGPLILAKAFHVIFYAGGKPRAHAMRSR